MVDLCEKCGHRAVCRFREHYEECLQFIEDVVRCKDCKHYYYSVYAMRCVCDFDNKEWDKDDFCSYGERKDNA